MKIANFVVLISLTGLIHPFIAKHKPICSFLTQAESSFFQIVQTVMRQVNIYPNNIIQTQRTTGLPCHEYFIFLQQKYQGSIPSQKLTVPVLIIYTLFRPQYHTCDV